MRNPTMSVEQKFENLLHQITLRAFAKLIGDDEDLTHFMFSCSLATSRRQIVDCIQFEEEWQCKIDETYTWYSMNSFKFAPFLCSTACDDGVSLNDINWQFAVPNVNTIEVGAVPSNIIEYLAMGRIVYEPSDEIDSACGWISSMLESSRN